MRNIFIGLMLVFIDFNLNIGSSQIGLIPDFAGYIVLAAGLREMAGESNMFAKAGPFASGMAVYTGIIYLMDLFGVSASLGVFFLFSRPYINRSFTLYFVLHSFGSKRHGV